MHSELCIDTPSPVSLYRHDNYDPAAVLDAARGLLSPLGGMAAFVPPGASVLLKPNLVMGMAPGRAVNTHPALVRAVVALLREAGAARIGLGDSPGYGAGRQAAAKAGYDGLMREFDVEWVEFTPNELDNPDGLFKTLVLARQPWEFDRVVNLAKLKTHGQMTYTGAVKNLFGCVPGFRKIEWHYRADRDLELFGRILYEIAVRVPTHLHIVDAIVGMDGLGPTSGAPNPTGFLAAGADPFAVDAIMLRILGRPARAHPPLAAAIGSGRLDEARLETRGAAPEECAPASWNWPKLRTLRMQGDWLDRHFPKFSEWLRNQMTARPRPGDGCVACGYCAGICPEKAIAGEAGRRPGIDLAKCIRCYCCHELCPHGAMELNPGGRLGRWLGIGQGRRPGPKQCAASRK